MKKCTKCQIEKLRDQFGKDSSRGDGLDTRCKECKSKWRKRDYEENKEERKQESKDYYDQHTEKCVLKTKEWWNSLSEDERRLKNTQYVNNYRKNNPEKSRAYQKELYYKNPNRRLSNNIRSGINSCLKGKNKRSWEELVGYNLEQLKTHLKSLFTSDMSWECFGRTNPDGTQKERWIEIDHIRPISSFNFDSFEHSEFKKCWALDNLQPMWHYANRSKGKEYESI